METVIRFGRRWRRRSFAAARSFDRFSFEAFISFGALVRSCLMCVGTNVTDAHVAGADSHGAIGSGTDSSSDINAENFGAELCLGYQ